MALPTSVLYFPYIHVPRAAFMTRLLLYWDEVATIVPDPWANREPKHRRLLLGDFTATLLEAGLVTMAVPTYGAHRSLDKFADHCENLPEQELAQRADSFKAGRYSLVHRAKFVDHSILPRLAELKLMSEAGKEVLRRGGVDDPDAWMWLCVERATARDFMSALAQAAAEPVAGFDYLRVEQPGAQAQPDRELNRRRIPVTQRPASLLALAGASAEDDAPGFLERLEEVRARLLRDVFPAPAAPVDAEWIVATKERFGGMLEDFRLAVERQVLDIVERGGEREALDWRVDLVGDEIRRKVRQIQEVLAESGIDKTEKVTFAALKALPVLGRAFGAVQEGVDAAFEEPVGPPPLDPRLAYGAFVRGELEKVAA